MWKRWLRKMGFCLFFLQCATPHATQALTLIAGSSHPAIAQELSQKLNLPLTKLKFIRFPSTELFVQIKENIRGEDVVVLQSLCAPVNENLMELLLILDTLKRSGARHVTACLPYLGYARQDRQSEPQTPISAKLVANLLTVAGAQSVITLDLHSLQVQGFFDCPAEDISAIFLFADDIQKHMGSSQIKPLVISPDAGGVKRAQLLAKRLGTDLVTLYKTRTHRGTQIAQVSVDIAGRNVIIIDDMVDSAGTLCNAADALKKNGARKIYAYATHGILSGKAEERINNSPLVSLTITNSLPYSENQPSKIKVLNITPLLMDAIVRHSQTQRGVERRLKDKRFHGF